MAAQPFAVLKLVTAEHTDEVFQHLGLLTGGRAGRGRVQRVQRGVFSEGLGGLWGQGSLVLWLDVLEPVEQIDGADFGIGVRDTQLPQVGPGVTGQALACLIPGTADLAHVDLVAGV